MTLSTSTMPDALLRKPKNAAGDTQLDCLVALLIFLGCLGYLCLFRHFTSMDPDEGILLQGATRVLDGQVPYRDFFSFYTPGSFYFLAAPFRVFGNSFLVARMSLALIGASCSVVTYVLARRVCSRAISVLAAVLATTVGTAFRFEVLHNYYSTGFACLAVYSAIRLVETKNRRWGVATGSLTALTFLFEQSKGGGLALGLLVGYLLLRNSLKHLPVVTLIAGLIWPFLITFGYFAAQHATAQMVSSWLWPLHHYTSANHVPYGWQNWSDVKRGVIFGTGPMVARLAKLIVVSPGFVVPALPLIAVALLFYWSKQLWAQQEVENEAAYYVVMCSALTGLLVSTVIVRPDILHFLYAAPLWYVVLAWILGAPVRNRTLLGVRPWLIWYVAIAFGMLGFAMLLATTGAHNRFETRRGVVFTTDSDAVIPYLQAHSSPGDAILVYPYLPLYNYLSATRSPSRLDFFQPGMNTDMQADEIIDTLRSTGVHAVLFEPGFAEKIGEAWPETPLSEVGRDPVSDYIAHNFRLCRVLSTPDRSQFEYMVRKASRCPR
jgi:4-amino-4-deoxy-L-arabinose transferase-like glycosyltransferase